MLYRAAKSITFPSQERKPGGADTAFPAYANYGTYLLIGYVDKILELPKLCATGRRRLRNSTGS